ncbi:MAG: HAD-superfamily subfamily hydrolase like protein [Gemmatimonadetes bacterium]|nr:HAD-superfamily subfamily hydrolase like protein [Gemmatimonadota bacterium]
MRPAGILCDLEGTLYSGDAPLPGATALVPRLGAAGIPFCFITNTTSRSRGMLVARLAAMGILVPADRIVSAPVAAAALSRDHGHRVVAPFLADAVLEDLEGLELAGGTAGRASGRATAVIVGDLAERWDYALLQEAYECLRAGAEFIACSRDRVYRKGERLVLDAGPFVAALEYASGSAALLAGKPSTAMYDAAFRRLQLPAAARSHVVMIGDDMHSDIAGAQQAGLTAWAVETGKFAAVDAARAGIIPDRIIPGIDTLLAELDQ